MYSQTHLIISVVMSFIIGMVFMSCVKDKANYKIKKDYMQLLSQYNKLHESFVAVCKSYNIHLKACNHSLNIVKSFIEKIKRSEK